MGTTLALLNDGTYAYAPAADVQLTLPVSRPASNDSGRAKICRECGHFFFPDDMTRDYCDWEED